MSEDSSPTVRRVALSELEANPHRNTERFPVRDEHVQQILDSFARSGVWGDGQIVIREVEGGSLELCFGHARLEAMREHYGPDHEIQVMVEDLSDEEMLRRAVDENEARRQHSARMDQEAVTAVVQAYADDRIELQKPPKRTPNSKLRFAPSFLQDTDAQGTSPNPYTASTVAEYLGWDATRVRDTLRALELIERDYLTAEAFRGQSRREARDMVRDLREALRRAHGAGDDKDGAEPDRGEDESEAEDGDDGATDGPSAGKGPPGPPPEVTGYIDALEEVGEADDPLQEVLPDLGSEVLEELASVQAAVLAVVEERHEQVQRLRGTRGS